MCLLCRLAKASGKDQEGPFLILAVLREMSAVCATFKAMMFGAVPANMAKEVAEAALVVCVVFAGFVRGSNLVMLCVIESTFELISGDEFKRVLLGRQEGVIDLTKKLLGKVIRLGWSSSFVNGVGGMNSDLLEGKSSLQLYEIAFTGLKVDLCVSGSSC